MAFATYVAKRSLASGHVLNVEYTIELVLMDKLGRSFQALKKSQESLSGKVESQFYGLVTIVDAELAPIPLNETSLVLEFLNSTADGQEFLFDPYGTEELPSDYAKSVIREDAEHKERRFMTISGLNDYVQYSFTLREA